MKALSIIRIAILVALSGIGIVLLLGEEQGNTLFPFPLQVLFDKTLAFATLYAVRHLYPRWRRVDPWISAYDKSC